MCFPLPSPAISRISIRLNPYSFLTAWQVAKPKNALKWYRQVNSFRISTGGGTRVLDGELVRGHEHWKRTNGRCFSEAWILNGENRSVALLGDILAGIKRDRNVSRELKKRKGKKVWETCLTSYLFCFILFYIVLMFLYFQSKSDIIPDIMDMDRWDDLIWLHYG